MLEPKQEQLLDKTYEIEKENNEMLHKMYRDMWWGRIFRSIYWIAFIGAMFGAYYYIQPYIEPMLENYEGLMKVVKSLSSFGIQ